MDCMSNPLKFTVPPALHGSGWTLPVLVVIKQVGPEVKTQHLVVLCLF